MPIISAGQAPSGAHASITAELARVRSAHAGRKLVFVPLDCRYGLIMLVFDREKMAIVDTMT